MDRTGPSLLLIPFTVVKRIWHMKTALDNTKQTNRKMGEVPYRIAQKRRNKTQRLLPSHRNSGTRLTSSRISEDAVSFTSRFPVLYLSRTTTACRYRAEVSNSVILPLMLGMGVILCHVWAAPEFLVSDCILISLCTRLCA